MRGHVHSPRMAKAALRGTDCHGVGVAGGWRYKVAFSIVLSLSQLVLMAYMPESPRSVTSIRS